MVLPLHSCWQSCSCYSHFSGNIKGRLIVDEFWFFKVVNLFIASLFLVGAWCSRKGVGVWLNPASILFLFWFLYTALPLLAAFEAPVNPLALIYILTFCLAFSLSGLVFPWSKAFALNDHKLNAQFYFDGGLYPLVFYLMAVFSAIMIFIGVLQQGISIDQVIENPISAGGVYAGKRYSGEIVSSVYAQLGLQASYCTAILGGLMYGARSYGRSRKLVLVFSFVPALLVMAMQSAKGLFFFSIFLFLGGILVARIYNKNYTLVDVKGFRSLFMCGLLVLPVVIASFLSRGVYQLNDLEQVLNRLRFYLVTYSSVHLPAFSDWFSERFLGESLMNYKQDYLTGGFYTFMSFFQLAGDNREVPMGTYDEYYAYGEYVKGNLYTIFRGLISDFGLIGSIFFGFVLGFLCNLGYWRLLCKRESAFAIVFFIFFVAFIYQTYTVSSLTWLTLPFVFMIQWAMLACLIKLKIR
nr:O-antigen polymerase [Pseudomonas guariconensis]